MARPMTGELRPRDDKHADQPRNAGFETQIRRLFVNSELLQKRSLLIVGFPVEFFNRIGCFSPVTKVA